MSDTNPCPHGIPHEQRKRDGCRKCDAESHDEFLAAQEAAKFRARVIATARAVLPELVEAWAQDGECRADGIPNCIPDAFLVAEAFERAADEYLKDGGGK